MSNAILEIDVAHPPASAEVAEQNLQDALLRVRNQPALRVIKVIHGYGSGGRGGILRDLVRDWAYRHRQHFDLIVYGEDYSFGDLDSEEIRQASGLTEGMDTDFGNPGITFLLAGQ